MKKFFCAAIMLAAAYTISAQEPAAFTTTSTTTVNYTSQVPMVIRTNFQTSNPAVTQVTWMPMSTDFWYASYVNSDNRMTRVYYNTQPWYLYEPSRNEGFKVALPVLNTYVPEDVFRYLQMDMPKAGDVFRLGEIALRVLPNDPNDFYFWGHRIRAVRADVGAFNYLRHAVPAMVGWRVDWVKCRVITTFTVWNLGRYSSGQNPQWSDIYAIGKACTWWHSLWEKGDKPVDKQV